MQRAFVWPAMQRFNIYDAICGRWANESPEVVGLRHIDRDDRVTAWRYRDLDDASARLANALADAGVTRGDRVAILLPQTPEALIAHLAIYRIAAIAVPLFTLFGADALAFRLQDSGATALITDSVNRPKLEGVSAPVLRRIVTVGGVGEECFDALLAKAAPTHTPAQTSPEDPALISYTSGTTGPPKGALHAHRVLLGHIPGATLVHDFPDPRASVFWTPADWAWMGGLCNIMMPALFWGATLLSHRMEKFDPERAFRTMAQHNVTAAFAPPTALKLMRLAPDAARHGLSLRTLGCGGEALGAELLDWGRGALGLTIHEFYGQTECNKMIANNAAIMPVVPGAMGRAVPGFDVGVIDSAGRPQPDGEPGEIAVRRGAGSMFLEYWGRPDKTVEKFAGDWMRTGDEGWRDPEGYFHFQSRADDVITSSGYRIGPSEIEDCLSGHPDVAMTAVIGEPDPVRTEIVVAHVVPRPGVAPDDALAQALIAHVRARLSPHVAPRRIVFATELPTTATGKIMRRELRRAASA